MGNIKDGHTEPIPPGGEKAFKRNLKKFLKYPDGAIKINAEGIVYISVYVEENGMLSDFKIEKDEIGHGCGEAAVKAIRKMPAWKPASVGGEYLGKRVTIPVEFRLKDLSRFHSKWYFNIWRRIEIWIIAIIILLYIFARTHIFSLYH